MLRGPTGSAALLVEQNAAHSSSRSGGSSIGDAETFEEEENPCIICHEELDSSENSTLDCGHVYHTQVCVGEEFIV
jgi:hypothetical protein